MRRRQILLAACVLASGAGRALAQGRLATPRIGLLWIESGSDSVILPAFREALRALGYVEGSNIHIDAESLVDRYERIPEAADKLIAKRVDVIVCYGATATLAARKATSTVPIVTITGSDPVQLGLVASLSKPGGNVTGVTFLHPQLDGKRLEVLQEVAPQIRRVGVLLNAAAATEPLNVGRWEAAARRLHFDVQSIEVRLQSDIDPVIAAVTQQSVDALAVVAGTMFMANRRQIVAAIAKTRLPAVYGSADYADVGGLLSYGPNVSDGFRLAAGHVAKILKGAKPADIPFEQATKFELAVNLKTARTLGIAIPQSILARADKVID